MVSLGTLFHLKVNNFQFNFLHGDKVNVLIYLTYLMYQDSIKKESLCINIHMVIIKNYIILCNCVNQTWQLVVGS